MREHNQMKKYLFGLLVFGCAMLSSCIKDDDDDVVLSSDCYIVDFSLESIKQMIRTKASDGSDSTYTVNIDGRYFPMTIDHRNQIIENRDSLPFNSIITNLKATVSYSGSMLSYRPVDAKEDSLWTAYKTSDSINFSKPLHFSVTALDGQTFRKYTVKLNVHQQEGDSLYWACSDSVVAGLEGMTGIKAAALDGKLLVLGQTENGVGLLVRDGLGVAGNWEQQNTSLPADADLTTLRVNNDRLYLTSESGSLYTSNDGQTWETLGIQQEGFTLAAVTNQFYYALMNGKLYRSADAVEWTEEELDEENTYLPQDRMLSVSYIQNNGNKRLFIAGASNDGDGAVGLAWSKMWRSDVVEGDAMWMHFNRSTGNDYYFPLLEGQSLFPYDGRLMTFGGKRIDKEGESMGCLYVSNDNGITWKQDLELHLPFELRGVEGPLAATVDANHYIWIIANQQVWRGRLNRLGFVHP